MERLVCLFICCVLVAPIYKAVAQCGGSDLLLNVTEIYKIYTIQYPSSGVYGENLICSWNLQSFYGQLMYIYVTSLASGDFLVVYHGNDTSGSNLDTISGTSGYSRSVSIPAGNFYIRFTSNGMTGADQLGFTIRYMSAVTDVKGGCSTTAIVEATDTIQYLTSPNFPERYPRSSSCSWNIESKNSCGSLVLDFILLDIEHDCNADKVTITYDGLAAIELCPSSDWDSASDYNTSGTGIAITLTTDGSDQKHGFVMSYIRTGCVNTVTGSTDSTTDFTTVSSLSTTISSTTDQAKVKLLDLPASSTASATTLEVVIPATATSVVVLVVLAIAVLAVIILKKKRTQTAKRGGNVIMFANKDQLGN